MKPYLLVLIAAVTVNCLVTAINAETSSEALTMPYIDMLLPPFEDKADSSGEAATTAVGKAEINVKAKVTPVLKTTKSKATAKIAKTTTTTTTTTKKPIINDVNNNLAAPSIEALLPPLFEAKAEEAVTTTATKRTTTTRGTTTTTRRPTTTTTRRPTTKRTTTTTTITRRPITTTITTLKPTKATKIQVPDLLLEPLLPPLADNEIVTKDELVATTTTQKPFNKTTKKSYYQQQQQQLKHLPVDNKKDHKNFHTLMSGLKTNDKHVAGAKIQTKQVTALPSNIETVTRQHVTKQTTASQERRITNSKQQNYNYDLYFGSTTPRPVKNGLPTITPFPHRLGR